MNIHVFIYISAVCACLAELTVNDTNAQQIVQGNGIYLVAKLLLPDESLPKALGQHSMNLQVRNICTFY